MSLWNLKNWIPFVSNSVTLSPVWFTHRTIKDWIKCSKKIPQLSNCFPLKIYLDNEIKMKKAKRKETKDKKKGKDAIVVPEGWVSPFGTTLQQQARANENGWFEIPFVELCIPFLLERGLQSEGIFRISGGVASLQRLQNAFERGTIPILHPYSLHALQVKRRRSLQLMILSMLLAC